MRGINFWSQFICLQKQQVLSEFGLCRFISGSVTQEKRKCAYRRAKSEYEALTTMTCIELE